ncbi:MAG TPA: DUF4347 domain-containing protein [Ohtaekwangia sp.]|uniref:DUF4347 domain-containing protein n=1 Tax=Ohtaekwangia sp. TaxID=2066019 RepID=UPI002F91CF04
MQNDLSEKADHGGALAEMLDAANENGSITVLRVSDSRDAANQIEDMGREIGNLIIGSHGQYKHASFRIGDGDLFNSANKIANNGNLSRIRKYLGDNSQIIVHACHVGNPDNGGVQLLTALALKMKTTVFGNQSWSLSAPGMFGGYLFGIIPYYQGSNDSPAEKSCLGKEGCNTYTHSERSRAFDNAGSWTKVTYSNGVTKATTINNVYYTKSGGLNYSENP